MLRNLEVPGSISGGGVKSNASRIGSTFPSPAVKVKVMGLLGDTYFDWITQVNSGSFKYTSCTYANEFAIE